MRFVPLPDIGCYSITSSARPSKVAGKLRSLAKIKVCCSIWRMSIAAINADKFVSEVLDRALVWGIRDKVGFPTSTNASGETAMPFWSSKKRATSVVENVPAYRDFEPVPIALSEFVDRWLPDLKKDGLRCGLNWSGKRATGYDLTPDQVLARLMARQGRS